MKTVIQFFKKHPIAIICYALYCWLCLNRVQKQLQFRVRIHHLKPGESGLSVGGEAIAQAAIFLALVVTIFVFVNIINLYLSKGNAKFYLWLSLLIIAQTVVVLKM
jgi:hypothetical protein